MPNWQKQNDEEEKEDWLVTYADAITLLMAFFVMLVSFSKVDIPMYEQVAAGIRNEIGKHDEVPVTKVMALELQDVIYNMEADQVAKVSTDDKGVVLEMASSAFYKAGSADIREEAFPVLEKIAGALNEPRFRNYTIEIEGHTDDDPISSLRYPSNWELSAGRASGVVRFFGDEGIDMTRMKAVGLADTQPKVPNRTPEGNPIPENMAQNRRVVVRVSPMSLEQQRQRQVGFEELLEESKRSGGVVSTPMNAPQGPMGLPNPDPEVRAREEQTLPPELRQQ